MSPRGTAASTNLFVTPVSAELRRSRGLTAWCNSENFAMRREAANDVLRFGLFRAEGIWLYMSISAGLHLRRSVNEPAQIISPNETTLPATLL